MTEDDLQEKLVNDLEARKRRDVVETAAWYNSEAERLGNERNLNAERLGVYINDLSVAQEFNNKVKQLNKDYTQRTDYNQKRHEQIDADIAAGRIDHVWIDANQEAKYFDAKKLWKIDVDEAERYGKFPGNHVYDRFSNLYGREIADQLVKDTIREFDQKQKQQAQLTAEKEQRVKVFQEQEAQRLQTEADQKLADQQKKARQQMAHRVERKTEQFTLQENNITVDRRTPVNPDIERQKIERKLVEEAVRRIKSKQLNPVDQTTDKFEKLSLAEKLRQKLIAKKEQDNLLKRINQDIENAREQSMAKKQVSLADQLRTKYHNNKLTITNGEGQTM